MSDLLSEIRAEVQGERSLSPKMDALYASLSAEERKDLLEAWVDESIPTVAIHRVLNRRQVVGESTVRAARNNGWRPA